ncbi:MAG: adenylate kinase [bacterium]|nr:MAG: adenylate kinase [bacterium]
MHLIILGPPGSGKGTQAARVSAELGLEHLSTGDVLREAVSSRTPLGVEAEMYMKQGALVPDEVILGLIREELDRLGETGWILDGFPRTLAQAESLTAQLEERGETIDKVLLIDVDSEEIVRRLTSRRISSSCNPIYNLATMSGEELDTCEKCGGKLVKRPDDEEETVRRRLEVYEEQTAPVIDFYRKRGGLAAVRGAGSIDEITAELLRHLA